jgi:hypothetical protein
VYTTQGTREFTKDEYERAITEIKIEPRYDALQFIERTTFTNDGNILTYKISYGTDFVQPLLETYTFCNDAYIQIIEQLVSIKAKWFVNLKVYIDVETFPLNDKMILESGYIRFADPIGIQSFYVETFRKFERKLVKKIGDRKYYVKFLKICVSMDKYILGFK